MTLLHQAAQKAVEVKQREAFEHWYSDAGRWPKSVARGEDGHYLLAQTNSSYEAWRAAAAALQQQPEPEWVAQVVSSGPHGFPLLEWRSANHSLETAIGTKLYTAPPALQHQEEPSTAVIPPAPPECETEDEKTAFAFGYWQGLHAARKG